MRTAVVLLALVAAAAIPGSLLPQRNVASDPSAVASFYAENPGLAPWLDRFQLFDVYASAWFASIYLLLLVSMVGCVLPRSARLWRSVRSAPPAAPRHLGRMDRYVAWTSDVPSDEVVARAEATVRGLGYRVEVAGTEVRGERGYLREVGNLMFHLSLLVLLVGVGAGRLFGFEGRVALVEGASFTNLRSQYDAFTPSVWTDVDGLEPFSFTLDDFDATFESGSVDAGAPRSFLADLTVTREGSDPETVQVRPNDPLDVNETKAFLTGHGYAPKVTVTDGEGNVAYSGPVMFLPLDQTYTSEGVVKVPDAVPTQLGFEGLFLPTGVIDDLGPRSVFPDDLNPLLVLTAFTGDLQMDDGAAQSVFTLDKGGMKQARGADGEPFKRALAVGETMRLPGGEGTLRFDGVARFANFQIAYDPGKEISLVAGVLLLVGLTASLAIRRRHLWVRVGPTGEVEVAARSVTRRPLPAGEVDRLLTALDAPRHTSSPTPTPEKETL
ncbi:cytochrome c biogenesis protein ResB [Nocardioides caricicola]|uniref:Cytochrome c biogenesis protein ResB n=1 Tax=Nocardioides caricicola TaxID=634770 RepID=A0ABW0N1W1_9ACTN